MHALQKPGRIAGLWFIGTFVFSIPAVLLYDPVLNDANYIFGGGLDARISLGALLEILLAISQHCYRRRLLSGPEAGERSGRAGLCRLAHRRVGDDHHGPHQPDDRRDPAGRLHRQRAPTQPRSTSPDTRWSPSTTGRSSSVRSSVPGFGNGLLLGYLMYRSELVPRRMAMLGLIGGPLAFIGGVFVLFGAFEDPSGALFAFTAIEIVWEASLAIYLTVKGYRPSPLLAEASPAESGWARVKHLTLGDTHVLAYVPGCTSGAVPDRAALVSRPGGRALQQHEDGATGRQLAERYGLARSTG